MSRVALRRVERLRRQRRHVVAVDDVVREAGMIRMLREERLEDRDRLQPARVGLVGQVLGRRERRARRRSPPRCRPDSCAARRSHRIAIRRDARRCGRRARRRTAARPRRCSRARASVFAPMRAAPGRPPRAPAAPARPTGRRQRTDCPSGSARCPTAPSRTRDRSSASRRRPAIAGPNSKECSSATARLNCGCAAAAAGRGEVNLPKTLRRVVSMIVILRDCGSPRQRKQHERCK